VRDRVAGSREAGRPGHRGGTSTKRGSPRPSLACVGAFLSIAIPAALASGQEPATPPVTAYVAVLGELIPPVAASALERIEGDGRKLLAARSYLRAGPSLAARWSWSDEQVARYEGSDEARAARAEVDRIKASFAESNPGYSLYVNVEVRSLDAQIASWNDNAAVGDASDVLLRVATEELARGYPGAPDLAAAARFARWLKEGQPQASLPLAAPGLSAHGQSRAFDFQVQQGTRIVAPTEVSVIPSVWDREGWAQRLAAAVAVSKHFRGPLASPREPWHYDYAP
jgi:hypothetical protein